MGGIDAQIYWLKALRTTPFHRIDAEIFRTNVNQIGRALDQISRAEKQGLLDALEYALGRMQFKCLREKDPRKCYYCTKCGWTGPKPEGGVAVCPECGGKITEDLGNLKLKLYVDWLLKPHDIKLYSLQHIATQIINNLLPMKRDMFVAYLLGYESKLSLS